jgi:hypothetical protein
MAAMVLARCEPTMSQFRQLVSADDGAGRLSCFVINSSAVAGLGHG